MNELTNPDRLGNRKIFPEENLCVLCAFAIEDVAWSTESVFEETKSKALEQGLTAS